MSHLAPPPIKYCLDMAAECLKPFAETNGLTLKPYEIADPATSNWAHHLYGKLRDRDYAIQVSTTVADGGALRARLYGFVKHWSSGGGEAWLLIDQYLTGGMRGLLTGSVALLRSLQLACVFLMPHPTDPDLKA